MPIPDDEAVHVMRLLNHRCEQIPAGEERDALCSAVTKEETILELFDGAGRYCCTVLVFQKKPGDQPRLGHLGQISKQLIPPIAYRLTPEEYLTHLRNHDDPNPEGTRREVWLAAGYWITDASHVTAAWDPEGFYWVRTTDLRVQL
ncbi:MAG TPA: hypothetical protein VKU80_17575 [Planctomycetota bacterium]|nr:hypothetical protein [Planctomycetota bacterium]